MTGIGSRLKRELGRQVAWLTDALAAIEEAQETPAEVREALRHELAQRLGLLALLAEPSDA
ncbi:MAG: hypothetical protein ACYCWW_08510 [Deltaproteobacteria bacterium]